METYTELEDLILSHLDRAGVGNLVRIQPADDCPQLVQVYDQGGSSSICYAAALFELLRGIEDGSASDPDNDPDFPEDRAYDSFWQDQIAKIEINLAEIELEAQEDAEAFIDEFGETLDPSETDWDETAWDLSTARARYGDGVRAIYLNALYAHLS